MSSANSLEASLHPDQVKQSQEIYHNLAASAGSKITESIVDELIQGSYDVHCHPGPEAYAGRTYDEIDLAIRGCQEGMGGIVFKCHSAPSAARVAHVQRVVDQWARDNGRSRIDIIGGVVLNKPVGGINPAAVDASARYGGRFVWTPSVDSGHHQRAIGGDKPGIEVVGDDGKLLPVMYEVFDLVAKYDLVLSLSHQSTRERFLMIREARKAGVKRILIDHPQLSITKATPEQMREMVDMGAMIGFYWQAAVPNLYNFDVKPKEMLEIIRVVGVENLAAGSDLGQIGNPNPVEGMRLFIKVLLFLGVSPETIRAIFVDNPRRLIY